jgi:hypothetical protein
VEYTCHCVSSLPLFDVLTEPRWGVTQSTLRGITICCAEDKFSEERVIDIMFVCLVVGPRFALSKKVRSCAFCA